MARKTAKVTKTVAYRQAASTLGESAALDAVQQYILDTFQIEMSKQQISQYRSTEKRRNGVTTRTANQGRKSSASGDAILEFVSSVRGWENKLGAKKICEVIEALYKV